VAFGVAHLLNLHTAAAVLLALLTILVIAQLGGFRTSLAVSTVAAVVITFRYLSPVGSIRIAQLEDWFVLVLFLLISIFGCQIVEKRNRKRFV
jgi:K+-sensing histidine kinase KdpD